MPSNKVPVAILCRLISIANSELDLDSPGEYYIDVDAGVVYLWPPAGVDMSEAAVHVSVSAHALRVTNAQHIVLRQLEFHFFRDALVRIDGSHNVSLEGCVIANGGMDGLIIRVCLPPFFGASFLGSRIWACSIFCSFPPNTP